MAKLTDKRLVLMALDAAIQWETHLRDGTPDVEDKYHCQKLINGYRRVIKRLTNNNLTITEMAYQETLKGSRLIGIDELREMAKRTPTGKE